MVDSLKRFREPLAWVLIALVVASIAWSIARLVVALREGGAVFASFQDIAANAMNLTLVGGLVLTVCVCLFVQPPTRHAAGVARSAAAAVTVGTILTIAATGLGIASSHGVVNVVLEALGAVVDIALKLVAVVVLWIIARAASGSRLDATTSVAAASPAGSVEPGEAPVWNAQAATGTVWKTAAEAAEGQSAWGGGNAWAASSAATPSAGSRPSTPDADPQALSAPAATGRPGAAEAMGWRRVSSDDAGSPQA